MRATLFLLAAIVTAAAGLAAMPSAAAEGVCFLGGRACSPVFGEPFHGIAKFCSSSGGCGPMECYDWGLMWGCGLNTL